MLFKDLHTRISQADPAWKQTGYWVGNVGLILTVLMGFGSFINPQIRASKFWKIPPCLILAGLALEGVEAIAANRRKS